MSVEADSYYHTQDMVYDLEPLLEGSEGIRSHHIRFYGEVVSDLVSSPAGDLESFMQTFSLKHHNDVQEQVIPDFRQVFGGRFDDETLPTTYALDVIGDDSEGFLQKTNSTLRQFLTDSDNKSLLIGPIKDRICKDCIFGGGNGGYHCEQIDVAYENNAARAIFKDASAFLTNPDVNERQKANPGYAVSKRWVNLDPSTPRRFADKSAKGLVVSMPLGLLRDVLVHHKTRWSDDPHNSYAGLIASKGYVIP